MQIVEQGTDTAEAKKEQEPLCAIYFQNLSFHSSRSTVPFVPFGVIVILWPNGEIYWSKNLETGGPPYQKGIVGQKKLREYLKAVNSIKGLEEQKTRKNKYFLLDVSFISITLSGNPPLVMQSWQHGLLHEKNPIFVRTEQGLMPLGGRNRKKVLNEQPVSFREFSRIWDEAKCLVLDLIPKEGQPAESVDFHVEHFNAPWPVKTKKPGFNVEIYDNTIEIYDALKKAVETFRGEIPLDKEKYKVIIEKSGADWVFRFDFLLEQLDDYIVMVSGSGNACTGSRVNKEGKPVMPDLNMTY